MQDRPCRCIAGDFHGGGTGLAVLDPQFDIHRLGHYQPVKCADVLQGDHVHGRNDLLHGFAHQAQLHGQRDHRVAIGNYRPPLRLGIKRVVQNPGDIVVNIQAHPHGFASGGKRRWLGARMPQVADILTGAMNILQRLLEQRLHRVVAVSGRDSGGRSGQVAQGLIQFD